MMFFRLEQTSDITLEKHIFEFKRLLAAMGEYAPDPWITSIVFIVSIDHRPYKDLIERILMKDELPTLNEIIKELNEKKTASGVIDEKSANVSHKRQKSEAVEQNVQKANVKSHSHSDTSTGRPDMSCPNCGVTGHFSKDCPQVKARCTVENCKFADRHCTKMHDIMGKYYSEKKKLRTEKYEKKLLKDVRKTNMIDINESITYKTTVSDVQYCPVITTSVPDDFFHSYEFTPREVVIESDDLLQCEIMNDIADLGIFDNDDDLLPSSEYTTTLYDEYSQWDPSEDDYIVNVCRVNFTQSQLDESEYILGDSASQITLVKDSAYVYDKCPMPTKKYVVAVNNTRDMITHQGVLPGFEDINIKAAIYTKGNGNVLSIPEVVDNGCTVTIDKEEMVIYNSDRDVVKVLDRLPSGFWGCFMAKCMDVKYGSVQDIDKKFSRAQIEAARTARIYHGDRGHIPISQLINDFDNGSITYPGVTSQGFRDAEVIFGPCPACTAKLNMPASIATTSPPPTRVGECLSGDWVPYGPKIKTLGGNTGFLFTCDQYSRYRYMVSEKSKHTCRIWDATLQTISHYNSHRHRVDKLVTDAESALLSVTDLVGQVGVHMSATVPYHHNKFVERQVQEARKLIKVNLCALTYVLPDFLFGELWFYVINFVMNCSGSAEHKRTSYEIVTGVKPDFEWVSFGQPCHAPMYEGPDHNKVMYYGIILGPHPTTSHGIRIYMKHTHRIITRKRSELVFFNDIPPEWQWTARVAHPLFGSREHQTPVPDLPVSNNIPTVNLPIQNHTTPQSQDDVGASDAHDDQQEVVYPSVTRNNIPFQNTTSIQEVGIRDEEVDSVGQNLSKNGQSEINQSEMTSNEIGRRQDEAFNLQRTAEGTIDSDDEDEIAGDTVSTDTMLRIPRSVWDEVAKNTDYDNRDVSSYKVSLEDEVICCSMSVKQALNGPHSEDAQNALMKEVDNMDKYGAWETVNYNDIPVDSKNDIINGLTLMTEKYKKGTGEYLLSKCRTVADGSKMNIGTYGNTATKMINMLLVFFLIQMGFNYRGRIKTYDINGAFLATDRDYEKNNIRKLWIRLNPLFTKAWLIRHPEDKDKVYNGCLYGYVKKNIYGLKDAGYEFYEFLGVLLKRIGYTRSDFDPCLFYKVDGDQYTWVMTWVDDILVIGNSGFDVIESMLQHNFAGYTQTEGYTFEYVGVSFVYSSEDDAIYANQAGAIQKLVDKYEIKTSRKYTVPANNADFTVDVTDSPDIDKHDYLSLIMSLMYIGRLTRPDILFPISYLATKSSNPKVCHFEKGKRVLLYLFCKKKKGLCLKRKSIESYKVNTTGGPFKFIVPQWIQADASYGIHIDNKGQTGIMIFVGGCLVAYFSNKQDTVSLSTRESEMYGSVSGIQQAVFLTHVCDELQIPMILPYIVYQDNQANITAAENGPSYKRGKHIDIRTSWFKEKIDRGEVQLLKMAGDEMEVDMLTKVEDKALYEKNIDKVLFDLPDV